MREGSFSTKHVPNYSTIILNVGKTHPMTDTPVMVVLVNGGPTPVGKVNDLIQYSDESE